MAYKGRTATLSVEQAQKLLSPVVDVAVVETRQIGFTNDVFRVTTRAHGNYYVKFHTARWYLDLEDTAPVVDRELSGHGLLRKRGIELPYRMWGDCTRTVVPQSVVISEHLAGEPVSSILARQPGVARELAETLGGYLRRLHNIAFTHRGALSCQHVLVAPSSGQIPYLNPHPRNWYGWETEDPCARAQREALGDLAEAQALGLLAKPTANLLEGVLRQVESAMRPRLADPHFALVNCHANHFHAQQSEGHWTITGVYDFESVSADDITNDLLEIEIGLTVSSAGYRWRDGFKASYGLPPDLQWYKLCLIRALVYYLIEHKRAGRFGDVIPDRSWLATHWDKLAGACSWDELVWYPARELAQP